MELILSGFGTPQEQERGYSTSERKKSNDQRKPSGYAIPVTSFPPKDNPAHNTRKQLRGQKVGSGKVVKR